MKNDYSKEMSPEIRERSKKNLVYLGIFGIVMMFAGLTSAYYVSMGDSFWLKFPLPKAFWFSTTIIILSSIFFELGIFSIHKKNNPSMLRLFMTLTLICGAGFVYFQVKGFKQLVAMGAHPSFNHIIVSDGRYGDYYEVKYNGTFLDVDGNDYTLNGTALSETQLKEFQGFMSQFLSVTPGKELAVNPGYGKHFILYYNNQPLGLINGKLTMPNGKELLYTDQIRLRDLAINVRDGRGDFFVKGKPGVDFHIYYKGREIQYKNRQLLYEGHPLSKYMQISLMESPDTATSYLYLLTAFHLLHIIFTLIYLLVATIYSYTGRYTHEDNLGLRVGVIFWHFLGLLWLYLLFFLLFIH